MATSKTKVTAMQSFSAFRKTGYRFLVAPAFLFEPPCWLRGVGQGAAIRVQVARRAAIWAGPSRRLGAWDQIPARFQA